MPTLQNEMQELRGSVADSSPNVLAFTETLGRQEAKDKVLVTTEYRLLSKDPTDGRKEGGITILVDDAVPAVPYHLPEIPHNDVLASDIGQPNCHPTLMCIYRLLRENV